jgi:hypothetical protein
MQVNNMIEEIDQIVKKENRKLFFSMVLGTIVCLFFLYAIFLQMSTNTSVIVMPVLALGSFITIPAAIKCLFRMIIMNTRRSIEKFCNKTANPKTTLDRLGKTWKYGESFGLPSIRIDKEYIIILTALMGAMTAVKIIPLKYVVWIHSNERKAKRSESKNVLNVFFNAQFTDSHPYSHKKYTIVNSDNIDIAKSIVRYISVHYPDIAVGDRKEPGAFLQNKDLDGLRAYARKRRYEQNMNSSSDRSTLFDSDDI